MEMYKIWLPINNSKNYLRAIQTAKPILRLVVQRQGECEQSLHIGRGGHGNSSMILGGMAKRGCNSTISISQPSEFRQVSSIIDFDKLHRRVRLIKQDSVEKQPLGLHIREGKSVCIVPSDFGEEKVPGIHCGIFISKIVPGSLAAESTGLLAVNDEVLEVNGINVEGHTPTDVLKILQEAEHTITFKFI